MTEEKECKWANRPKSLLNKQDDTLGTVPLIKLQVHHGDWERFAERFGIQLDAAKHLSKEAREAIGSMILGRPANMDKQTDFDKGFTKGYYDAKKQMEENLAALFEALEDL